MFLYPVHPRKETFLLRTEPLVVTSHRGDAGGDAAREELVQRGEKGDGQQVVVVVSFN
jgi:hypothetical protein